GSNGILALVTCTGDAWILSSNGNLYSDGTVDSNANDIVWHRIKAGTAGNPELTNVVAVRGTLNGAMALTATGDLYTWGSNVRTGVGNAVNLSFATLMNKPVGTPKMIGMTGSTTAGITQYVL